MGKQVTVDEVREAYHRQAPFDVWIRDVEFNPLRLIVAGNRDGSIRRVPVHIADDGTITFGEATPVQMEYAPSTARGKLVRAIAADERSGTRVQASVPDRQPGTSVRASVGGARLRIPPRPAGADPRYLRNPLVDRLRGESRTVHAAATGTGRPAPTLFTGGDLPPYTASGFDPQQLLQLPWYARHAAAAARTIEAAQDVADDATDPHHLVGDYERHPGNQDYEQRVSAWAAGGMGHRQTPELDYDAVDEQLHSPAWRSGAAEQRRRDYQRAVIEGRSVASGYQSDQVRAMRAELEGETR